MTGMIDRVVGVGERGARVAWVTLTTLLALCDVSIEAEPAVRNVLMLQSLNRGNLPLDAFTGHFRVELDRRAGIPVNLNQAVIDSTAPDDAVVDYIRATYAAGREPDLIVTAGGPA